MKIFIICPVRNASEQQKTDILSHILTLEASGHIVHYPARDTDQSDPIGLRICTDNCEAIRSSDEVHVFWDKNSSGSLFDLGVAFGMKKKIVLINRSDVERTDGKSFSNMITAWERSGI